MVRGPYLQDLGSRSAAVMFELEAPHEATVEVVRGAPPGPVVKSVKSSTRELSHELVVSGLEPATSYGYAVTLDDGTVEKGTFTTAPEDDRPFGFLLYGDNRTNVAAHGAIVRAMRATPGDFLLNTGDMVGDGSATPDWVGFFGVERELLRERCLFPAIGNHEIALPTSDGAQKFARMFRLPSPPGAGECWYTFRWGMARFFMLDAQDEFGSEERDWLESALRAADSEPGLVWRFAAMHHGPFSSGLHGPNQAAVMARLPELLRAHKVDALFSGHDHAYERGDGDGLKYLMSGGGGAPLYREYHAMRTTQKFEPTFHFVKFELGKSTGTFTAFRLDGSVLDRCSFLPGGALGWSCGAGAGTSATGASSPAASGAASPAPPGPAIDGSSATKRRSCGCEALGGSPAWIGLALAGVLVAAAAVRREGRRRP